MLHPTNDTSPNLGPIDARVQLLVYETAYGHILSADQVQAVAFFGTRFFIIRWAYHALNGLAQDKVCELIAGKQDAGQRSTICREDENSL